MASAALFLLLVFPSIVFGQGRLTGADLDGTVLDQSGAVLPRATITITNLDTNIVRTVVTDDNGRYRVPALLPGSYSVVAALSGFTAQRREAIVLLLGQVLTLDFHLNVAGTQETVTVSGDFPLAHFGTTEVSLILDQSQIQNLPINGRNFISFSIITPGVTPDRTPQQGATMTTGLSFSGQRARSNNIMVDGLDNNDITVGAVRATFSQEAIREFQVLANSYSAEFGKASAGVVNIVTKGGGNTFHGNAFLYFRDKNLNAKSYFERFDVSGDPINLEKAPFAQKQMGGTLGGPILKDKSFFFLSVERTSIKDSRLVNIDSMAATALQRMGFPVELGVVPLAIRNTEFFGRVDHNWSPTHWLTLRGNYADSYREGIDEFGGRVARSRGTVQLRRNWAISTAETDVLSPKWTSEFRLQYVYEDQRIYALDPRCGEKCLTDDQGGPTLELAGVASVGRHRYTPQLRLNNRVQLLETLSYFNIDHRFKAGVDYSRIGSPAHGNELPLHFGGRYIFGALPALGVISALDALERGLPSAYIQGYGNSIYPRTRYADVSIFGQDDWKLGRFLLKLGIRYQRQFWEKFSYAVSDVGGGTFSYALPRDTNNIAPRLGASYDVKGQGQTSLHAGYGMFYDNIITAIPRVGQLINGAPNGVRTLLLTAPRASIAWNAPGRQLSEAQALALLGGSYPSVTNPSDPALKTSYTHHVSTGINHALKPNLAVTLNLVYVRGFNIPGAIDYNPILPTRLGAGRRPNDQPCSANVMAGCVGGGIPGTSASVLQYTSFGESWYRGLTASLKNSISPNHQVLLSYTFSKAEDTITDFQTNFVPQNNGLGRDSNNKAGLPMGFDPRLERGPATHDQRHRLVGSTVYQLRWNVQVSAIATAASGRPFTPLAGVDLNGDGNGGSFPTDRARLNPADESTSVGRNSETTAAQYNVDVRISKRFNFGRSGSIEVLIDAFNLFNRTNFVEDTNQSSFVIFGSGPFPTNPVPTYGKYTLTMPPRQVQFATKFTF